MQVKQINTPLHTPLVTLHMHTLQAHARATVRTTESLSHQAAQQPNVISSPRRSSTGSLEAQFQPGGSVPRCLPGLVARQAASPPCSRSLRRRHNCYGLVQMTLCSTLAESLAAASAAAGYMHVMASRIVSASNSAKKKRCSSIQAGFELAVRYTSQSKHHVTPTTS
jgi:hypothetical protein